MKRKPVFNLHPQPLPGLAIATAALLVSACQGSPSAADLTATALADPTGLTPRALPPTWTQEPTLTPLPSRTPTPVATSIVPTSTSTVSPTPVELPERLVPEPIALGDLPVIDSQNASRLRLVASFPAPNGYRLAQNWSWLAIFTPGHVHLYDLREGHFARILRLNAAQPTPADDFAFTFSNDGSLMAWTPAPGTVEVKQTDGGAVLQTFEASTECCERLAFSPDNALLFAIDRVEDNLAEQAIRLWNLSTGVQILQLNNISGVSFSSDGSMLAFFQFSANDQRQLLVWDVPTREVIFRQTGPFDFAFLPEGKQLMYGIFEDGQVFAVFYDLETGGELRRLSGFETAAPIISVGFSPDYRSLVWEARASQLMDVSTGRLSPSTPIDYYLRFSPEAGDLIGVRIGMVVDPSQAPLVVLDRQSGEVLHGFDIAAAPGALQFSPASRLLAAYDQQAELTRILDLAAGEIVMTLDIGQPHAFSPDGRLLAMTGADQGWIWAVRP